MNENILIKVLSNLFNFFSYGKDIVKNFTNVKDDFINFCGSLQCFIFLIIVKKCIRILVFLPANSISWKKGSFLTFSFAWNSYRSGSAGSGKMM
jgi:hypothetical protein